MKTKTIQGNLSGKIGGEKILNNLNTPQTIQGIEGWEERFTELDNHLLKNVYGYLPSGKHRVHRQLDEIDFIASLISDILDECEGAIPKEKDTTCDLPDIAKMCDRCQQGLIYNQALEEIRSALKIIRERYEK